jgi:hypothetical protein
VQHSAKAISSEFYIAPTQFVLRRLNRFIYFPELTYHLCCTDRKQKYGIKKVEGELKQQSNVQRHRTT